MRKNGNFSDKLPIQMRLAKRKTKKDIFRYLFILFRICCILDKEHTSNSICSVYFQKIFPFIINTIVVLYAIVNTPLVAFHTSNLSVNRANATITVSSLIHRWILCSRIDKLHNLSFHLIASSRRRNLYSEKSKHKLIYIWSSFSILGLAYLGICSVLSIYPHPLDPLILKHIESWTLLKIFIRTVYAVVMVTMMILPVSVFAMYYTAMCQYLCGMLKKFRKSLQATANRDYGEILKFYLFIRKLVSDIDSELSILMFSSSLYYASTTYFGLTTIIHQDDYWKDVAILPLSTVWVLFATNFAAFMTMTVSGSSIYDESANIWSVVQETISPEQNLTPTQKRFLSVAEKELAMTAWKIAPVKRSFIIATLGTIVTYCILLDSL
ncbi:hypothetical protein AVEN_214508-1 [Araneus ventricosus]|uniref:Gustatory receptor n=1 Tax=Araneus ventricosus TaxID=182803 RepID=A0A4Y2DCR9_ARAVE|nr:hypothetical protein AVEN_214508-1 [Araneus ventricosus]